MTFVGRGGPARLLLGLLLMTAGGAAFAHPADEFCSGDSGLDPALCRELARLDSGSQLSGPDSLPRVEIDRGPLEVARIYTGLGFVHIVPRGLDHILFVLALFLASTRFRSLLLQVSVFTLAHTITLALAASGKISAPGNIVEPLIAASIAFVAIENLYRTDISRWRPLVVFGFGLFHGLGFAGVLQELGLPQGQFLVALVSFNVGVELGQISVIMIAWLLTAWAFRRAWYRRRIVAPASLAIALAGLWWAIARTWPAITA
ncbi:MAG: HupE/UreJ family protein [Xanthomonadales bacterium]|nr:HupE/UreJ family protein [Xanthomonadales bacterium]